MDLWTKTLYDDNIKGIIPLKNNLGGKKMKKKVLAAVMAAAMVLALTACGGKTQTTSKT